MSLKIYACAMATAGALSLCIKKPAEPPQQKVDGIAVTKTVANNMGEVKSGSQVVLEAKKDSIKKLSGNESFDTLKEYIKNVPIIFSEMDYSGNSMVFLESELFNSIKSNKNITETQRQELLEILRQKTISYIQFSINMGPYTIIGIPVGEVRDIDIAKSINNKDKENLTNQARQKVINFIDGIIEYAKNNGGFTDKIKVSRQNFISFINNSVLLTEQEKTLFIQKLSQL